MKIVGKESEEARRRYLLSISELAYVRGAKVVVTGLEQKTAWTILARAGIDGAMGYAMDQPMMLPDNARSLN